VAVRELPSELQLWIEFRSFRGVSGVGRGLGAVFRYVTRRSSRSAVKLSIPNIRWPMTLTGPPTRTVRARYAQPDDPRRVSLISAACGLEGRALAAQTAKARENVASLGTAR